MDKKIFLPCPFCGGEPNIKYGNQDVSPGYEFHNIYCRGCGAQFWVESKEEAIQKWNTRFEDEKSHGTVKVKVELDTDEAEQRLQKMTNDLMRMVEIMRTNNIGKFLSAIDREDIKLKKSDYGNIPIEIS